MRRGAVLAVMVMALVARGAGAQEGNLLAPAFAIWDVVPGMAVTDIPEQDVTDIACGTNGGPPSTPLRAFDDFAACAPEASGLREVVFSYDDEMDYVARALGLEYDVLQDGTTVFSHPVVLSVLVDDAGVVQGYRILTDPRIPDRERRRAVTLMRNLIARFSDWSLDCRNLPLAEGEQPVGNGFTKNMCEGVSPDGSQTIRLDSRYLRKAGQEGLNRETRAVNTGYFESFTRLEVVRAPFAATPPPVRGAE